MSAVSLPAYDEEAVRRHVGMVHTLARGVEGEVVVAAYGENPALPDEATGNPGRRIPGFVRRYAVGDARGTAAAILCQQERPHSNVYMPLHVVRLGLGPNNRGGRKDIVAVLGLVVDADADKGEAPRRIGLKPSFTIASSPGNEQQIYLFDRPLPVDHAEHLAWALKLATNSDSGTGDVAHVWRVPGCLNWPNAAKVARGRPAAPTPVRVSEAWNGERVSVAELERVLEPWLSTPRAGAKADSAPLPDDDRDLIELDELPDDLRELVELGTVDGQPPGDRSKAFMKAVLRLWERGHGHHRIADLLEINPAGIGEKYGDRVGVEVERVCRKAAERVHRMFDHEAAAAAAQPPQTGKTDEGLTFGFRDGSDEPIISEDEAAIQFAERWRDKLRFSVAHGRWFVWNGGIWRENTTSLAFTLTREHIRMMAALHPEKVRIAAGKAAFAGAVERYARADRAFAVTSDAWDSDPWLLGTPGGTVDLRSGELRPARPEDGITRCTAVAPAETANCPLWLRLLEETFAGDAPTIRFFRQWCGYSLTGDTREQSLVYAHGKGGNGKGLTLNTVGRIAGSYTVTAAAETFVAGFGTRHSTELAMLAGARIVKASEMERGQAWAEKRIKELTGGDEITARFMRQDNFTYLPTFKLTIMGNSIPDLHSVDDAMRRRFNLLPFVHTPTSPDRGLEEKLKPEWPAILRWMLDGCLDWQANGLSRPETVKVATAAYFAEQDTLGQWAAEHCTVDRNAEEATARLFASWSTFAKAAGVLVGSEKAFAQEVKQRFDLLPKAKVPLPTGGRARGFVGIALRSILFQDAA